MAAASQDTGSRFSGRVYRSFDEVQSIRDEWTRLASKVDGDLFGSFEWCETWWKHFSSNRKLEIHAIRHGADLVALLPLFRETIRWGPLSLRVVRLLGTDHAGTRVWPLFESQHATDIFQVFITTLNRGGIWDVLHIGDLPGYFGQTEVLCNALMRSARGQMYTNRDYYPQAVFTLPGDFDKYLESLSGNERNNIRKNERRLFKTHQLHNTLVSDDRADEAMGEFFHWHDEYWNAQNELGFFSLWPGSREFHAEFARTGSESGTPLLMRVSASHEPVGMICAHRYNRRLHLFQAVRAPGNLWDSFGPGRLLHCEVFRWCMDNGIPTVDAMSGFYEYKRRLGAEFLGLTTVAVVRNSMWSGARAAMFRLMLAVVDACYFRFWLCRFVPLIRKRLKIKPGRLLRAGMAQRFIRSRFVLIALRNPRMGHSVKQEESGRD